MSDTPSCAYNGCRGCGLCSAPPPRPNPDQLIACGHNGCRGCGNCYASGYWEAHDRASAAAAQSARRTVLGKRVIASGAVVRRYDGQIGVVIGVDDEVDDGFPYRVRFANGFAGWCAAVKVAP